MCSNRKHPSSTINSYTLEFIPKRKRKWRKTAGHGTQGFVLFRTKELTVNTEEADLAPSPTTGTPMSAPGPDTSQIPSQAAQEGRTGDPHSCKDLTASIVSERAFTAPRRYEEQNPYPLLRASSILSSLRCNSLLPRPQMRPSHHRASAHAVPTLG